MAAEDEWGMVLEDLDSVEKAAVDVAQFCDSTIHASISDGLRLNDPDSFQAARGYFLLRRLLSERVQEVAKVLRKE